MSVFEEPRDALYLLQRWYVQQCDDDREHSHGVTIDTLDNPGWSLNVDLADTAHAGTTRDWSQVERSKHDWIHWRVHQDRFEAACGPTNLNEAILAFLDLVGRELRSEPRTNAAAPPARVERIRAYHGLPEPMRAAWLEPTSPLTPTCNGLIETTDRFLRAAQDQGLAKESLQASDLYLAALAVAWAEDAPTATTATGHVLSTMLRRGWSTAS